jgi:hypothetical protein
MEPDKRFQQDAATSVSFKIPSDALTPPVLEKIKEVTVSALW